MSVIIAGIGTDVGKTVISAIMCKALKADYWKPVQAGDLDHTDSHKVKALVGSELIVHPERHRLMEPMSPHAAAIAEGFEIKRQDFIRPDSQGRPLVTELAGGLMVPISPSFLTLDLAEDIGDPIVVVASSYLGSINHTLLTLELIKQRGLKLAGLVFNGETNLESREVILSYSGATCLADIPKTDKLDQSFVETYATHIQDI